VGWLPPPLLLLLCVGRCRLEGTSLAQNYALSLATTALRRGQFYLCSEILRFLIPPRESCSGLVQWGPLPAGGGVEQQQQQQQQPSHAAAIKAGPGSGSGAAAAGGANWLSWLWGGSSDEQQQVQRLPAAPGSTAGAAGPVQGGKAGDLLQQQQQQQQQQQHFQQVPGVGEGSLTSSPGAQAFQAVAEKGWQLLDQVTPQ
jgi:hypothetical protein